MSLDLLPREIPNLRQWTKVGGSWLEFRNGERPVQIRRKSRCRVVIRPPPGIKLNLDFPQAVRAGEKKILDNLSTREQEAGVEPI
jgi:hypothetical protein